MSRWFGFTPWFWRSYVFGCVITYYAAALTSPQLPWVFIAMALASWCLVELVTFVRRRMRR